MQRKVLQDFFIPGPKLSQLRILAEIASNSEISQSKLAQRCALSVAMVNNYMKELRDDGLLEYRRKSSKTISYHLTHAGQGAAGAAQPELLQELVKLFVEAREKVREIILSQCKGNVRRVVLYGTRDLAELTFHALEHAGLKIVGVCDDDPVQNDREWCGREIFNPSQVRYLGPDAVVIADSCRMDEISRAMSPLAERGIQIITVGGPTQASACLQALPPAGDGNSVSKGL